MWWIGVAHIKSDIAIDGRVGGCPPGWCVATLLCRAVSAELPAAYPSLAASGS
eukprot:COSAG04_NODE_27658_length_281_cov_0.571429_1_plen_52_part_10